MDIRIKLTIPVHMDVDEALHELNSFMKQQAECDGVEFSKEYAIGLLMRMATAKSGDTEYGCLKNYLQERRPRWLTGVFLSDI